VGDDQDSPMMDWSAWGWLAMGTGMVLSISDLDAHR
jgi:hypothetical protein